MTRTVVGTILLGASGVLLSFVAADMPPYKWALLVAAIPMIVIGSICYALRNEGQ